jgi:hypothetical protein
LSREDDRDRDERRKLTFSERDRLLRERGKGTGERRPRGAVQEERARVATSRYKKQLDAVLFGKGARASESEALARAVREAHGTPGLAAACRAYREAHGLPEDVALLQLFLDARDPELVEAALGALETLRAEGRLAASSGLRSQLRLLAQEPDDAVAEAAESLLARL